MVRFFGKPRKAGKDAEGPGDTPKSTNGARAKKPAEAADSTIRRAPRRRTTTARPPRRDWAAEAAATPVEAPAPPPVSLAAAPTEEGEAGIAPAKRRRGTRGGRGRKKPAAAPEAAPPVKPPPAKAPPAPKAPPKPPTLEEVVARQTQVLEHFTTEVSGTLKALQTTINELQVRVEERVKEAAKAHPRVGIFVDVPNLIYAAERRNVHIDFGRVLAYFTRDRELVRATAYAPITDDPQARLETQRFVHHFLGHPYRIITKPLKRFADGSMKANFDIELAIDILTMSDRLDVVVLMSGDGDFRRVVELVASRGVRVEVVAFGETAAAELKAVADLYIDIGAHLDEFKVQK